MDKKSDQDRKNAPLHKNGTKPAGKDSEKNKRHESFARAAGEDDDGYDPWSDRVIKEPFWEKDPWD